MEEENEKDNISSLQNQKSTILHIIDTLGVGGAENIVRSSIKSLNEFTHVVVCLNGPIEEVSEFSNIQVYNLHHTSNFEIFKTVRKLQLIIRHNSVDLVHSHLFYSTLISRLAVNKSIPLVSTYHSLLYDPSNEYQYSWYFKWLDRLTYRSRFFHIYVSKAVKEMYESQVKSHKNYSVLYNFIEEKFYKHSKRKTPNSVINVITVGNLRPEKEHIFLIKAFSKLSQEEFQLTIVGNGKLKGEIISLIRKLNIENINLVDNCQDIAHTLAENDMFVSCSSFEGFGIAVVEAMAKGLPCLLSAIPAHKEIAGDNGMFFRVNNENEFLNKLFSIAEDNRLYDDQRSLSLKRSKLFSESRYLKQLKEIYMKLIF